MSLLAILENYINNLEQQNQRLQQQNQILEQTLQESKGINPKKDNKK
jgi:hypothetical protein